MIIADVNVWEGPSHKRRTTFHSELENMMLLAEQQYQSEIKKPVGAFTSFHEIYIFLRQGKKTCKTVIFSPHQHPNAHMQILC